jgi:hypothetical protein
MAGTCLLAMRCPVWRRRDSNPGYGRELANLLGDGKGKGTSGGPARPKVPRRPTGADCFVVAVNGVMPVERRERVTRVVADWVNRNPGRNPLVAAEGGSLR